MNVIQRARQEIMELQRRRSVSRRHKKLEDTESKVEIELFLDDCKAEGLDPNNLNSGAKILTTSVLSS
jgi:hypothetical protein